MRVFFIFRHLYFSNLGKKQLKILFSGSAETVKFLKFKSIV